MFRFSPFSLILGVLAIVSLATEILLGSSLAKIVTTPAIMLVVMVLSEVIRILQERAARRAYAHVAKLAPSRASATVGARVRLCPGASVAGDVRLDFTLLPREVACKRGEKNFRRDNPVVDEALPLYRKILGR